MSSIPDNVVERPMYINRFRPFMRKGGGKGAEGL